MNSLESVRTLLIDHLEEASLCGTESEKLLLIFYKKDFQLTVYNAFFKLIADPTQSPERIIHLLDTFTRGLDGFSTNTSLQALVAYACFEALAKSRPKALNGPWETLAWIIVKYSSFSNTVLGNMVTHFKKTNIETLKFITEFGSPELCPNPCLRLELFRFIRSFNCNEMSYDRKSFRDRVINTLFDLCDNYTTLAIDQVPNINPINLQYVNVDNNINIGYIMNNYDLKLKRTKIIAAFLKLTRNFALLEKKKHQKLNNQAIGYGYWDVDIRHQLSACLSFCGLIPLINDDNYNKSLVYLVQAVGNDYILRNYVIDTLDTITQLSISFPENDNFQDSCIHYKNNLFHTFLKGHTNQFPKFQYRQEMYGGLTPAEEYQIRYFQNNAMDQYIDSDSDSECNASDENDYGNNVSEENDSEIDISE